jgi:hypothetical protein
LKRKEAITKLRWTVLPRSLYSPDFASSDFYLFGALKNAIRGKRFERYDDVIEGVSSACEYRSQIGTRRG